MKRNAFDEAKSNQIPSDRAIPDSRHARYAKEQGREGVLSILLSSDAVVAHSCSSWAEMCALPRELLYRSCKSTSRRVCQPLGPGSSERRTPGCGFGSEGPQW